MIICSSGNKISVKTLQRCIMNRILRLFCDSKYRFMVLNRLGLNNMMSDKKYLQKMFYYKMGKPLDLKKPKTFNEKLQWLKLYDRKPEYVTMVDKYSVKNYVARKIGKEYVIPTLGVWERFDDIEFDKLPKRFVLKCTHDSGGLVICKNKSTFNKNIAKKRLIKV